MADFALQTIEQLFLRQAALIEEALHQRVVALGDLLDELLAPVVGLGFQLRGDVDRLVLARAVGRVLPGLHRHEVDDAGEVFLLADRQLDGDDVLAELLLQRVERARERGALAVHLVDDDEPRQLELLGELPDASRS